MFDPTVSVVTCSICTKPTDDFLTVKTTFGVSDVCRSCQVRAAIERAVCDALQTINLGAKANAAAA